MKALTTVVISFGVFAYDLSYNNGEVFHSVCSFLGLT
jgi:hypothetical protein